MLDKLQVLEDKYMDLTEKISDMEVRTCGFRTYR